MVVIGSRNNPIVVEEEAEKEKEGGTGSKMSLFSRERQRKNAPALSPERHPAAALILARMRDVSTYRRACIMESQFDPWRKIRPLLSPLFR
jgi:hypothetical protein